MWKKISLRIRIYLILALLVLITFSSGLVMVWYTYRIESLFTYIIDKNIAASKVAEELQTALVNQKGFVTYFFLDGNPDWLRQLGEYRQIFKERLRQAHSLSETATQREALKRLETEYGEYIGLKDQVIAYYEAGKRDLGALLHKEARDRFFKSLELCEEYRDLYAKRMSEVRSESIQQATKLRVVAGTAIFSVLCLGIILAFVLTRHILEPVRRLALEADRKKSPVEKGNEMKALSKSVRGLLEDVDQTQLELEKSRETLLQAEKMAVVGKLAAGVAHSIRNPLTSVKMRLFSLNRTLDISQQQKEDFEVISEEIGQIDKIVQNFLEFSRPPKLKVQRISPSEVVDMVLQLLQHRLESSNMSVKVFREKALPQIQLDPDLMKEVFINLIVNACEAAEGEGRIEIHEQKENSKPGGGAIVIRLSDNGPGIPESIREKVLQPFYTSKEEGTGLGLSIAQRIVENHGGKLEFESEEGEGTTFIIILPMEEKIIE